MAKAEHSLTPEHVEEVAREIAKFPVRRAVNALGIEGRRLGEHFDLWNLVKPRQIGLDARLEEIARSSKLTHHQIRRGHVAEQFAWSKPDETGRKVVGVFTSDLANQIHGAAEWVDRNVTTEEDEPVRLLSIPVLRLHALWLVGREKDRLVMIHAATGRSHPKFTVRTARQVLPVLARKLAKAPGLENQQRPSGR